MAEQKYPKSPSHRTFTFGQIIIDSDFDSGNCSHAQKVSHTCYQIWIGTDHPKNNYRTWFYFSVHGFSQGTCVTFKVKNMQNQSKMLSEGLVPVFREQSSAEWKRIKQKINLNSIEYNQGWIQWSFKHTFTSSNKVFLAFFYPWSNQDNNLFLNQVAEKANKINNIYFYRGSIVNTLQGRNTQFIVISSNLNKLNKQEKIQDKMLFPNCKKPMMFAQNKKGIVLSARVHPGEVPGSHLMTGIIKQLIQDEEKSRLLRDHFVFYIFPILNPDGVARGHYRVDTNGINLNRCYLNPTIKSQPTIYVIRHFIIHLNSNNRFFAFLDLHAHASRRGTFIYGNSVNQLKKQVQTCLFPKILSLNSADFEYQASNFTQQNMYCKDKSDHMSKQGSGRVAMFKATKNPFCWTLQCNYNMSKLNNILQPKRKQDENYQKPKQGELNQKIIVNYRSPVQKQATEFFTIQTFYKLGKQICQSFLDLIQKNPQSRINNANNYFKSVQNLKMNLAIALLRMAPNRFQSNFRKIFNSISSQNQQVVNRSIQALYYLIIKNAKIANINLFIKDGDFTSLQIEQPKKIKSTPIAVPRFSSLLEKTDNKKQKNSNENDCKSQKNIQKCCIQLFDFGRQGRKSLIVETQRKWEDKLKRQQVKEQQIQNLITQKLKLYQKQKQFHRVTSFKLETPKLYGLASLRNHLTHQQRDFSPIKTNKIRFKPGQLPVLKKRGSSGPNQKQTRNIFYREYVKDPLLFVQAD